MNNAIEILSGPHMDFFIDTNELLHLEGVLYNAGILFYRVDSTGYNHRIYVQKIDYPLVDELIVENNIMTYVHQRPSLDANRGEEHLDEPMIKNHQIAIAVMIIFIGFAVYSYLI